LKSKDPTKTITPFDFEFLDEATLRRYHDPGPLRDGKLIGSSFGVLNIPSRPTKKVLPATIELGQQEEVVNLDMLNDVQKYIIEPMIEL